MFKGIVIKESKTETEYMVEDLTIDSINFARSESKIKNETDPKKKHVMQCMLDFGICF